MYVAEHALLVGSLHVTLTLQPSISFSLLVIIGGISGFPLISEIKCRLQQIQKTTLKPLCTIFTLNNQISYTVTNISVIY